MAKKRNRTRIMKIPNSKTEDLKKRTEDASEMNVVSPGYRERQQTQYQKHYKE